MSPITFQADGYSGEVLDAGAEARLVPALGTFGEWLRAAVRMPTSGPHSLARHSLEDLPVAIKSFSPSWLANRGPRGSRGRRSFRTALRLVEHGVGTPAPLAYLDRWQGGRLIESHYVCRYHERAVTFREELNRLFRDDPLSRRIMALMQAVAAEVARMHDAGVWHLDLGNQNILLTRADDDTWTDVRFIDLDRARVLDRLELRHRARDISRIALPSGFLRIFRQMYFAGAPIPAEYLQWESTYRWRHALHSGTRKYRHPIRTLRKRESAPAVGVPKGQELWIWDDLSAQAIGTRERSARYSGYPWANAFHIVRGLTRGTRPVLARYRELLDGAFQGEVDLAGRVGIAVGTEDGVTPQEQPLIAALGGPVLLRLYRHESRQRQARVVADARRLQAAGHPVYLALVQDRACIREPRLWGDFVEEWLPQFSGIAGQVEIGHAVNRVKWGIWDLREYRAMVEVVAKVAARCGPFRLTGPAAIDFEYHFLAGFLDVLPQDGTIDALSHHLYVDRRGAPENRQGRFAAVEKFALARAFAEWSPAVRSGRLIVSEVNWPVRGTGVHSPVCAPYIDPARAASDMRGVDEESGADFAVRYYALALCSGLVDSVYWWRLAARGYGLVDDGATPWRPRAGYAALRHFAQRLGNATYVGRVASPDGSWALRFRLPAGGEVVMAWAHPRPVPWQPPFAYDAMLSRDGAPLDDPRRGAVLGSAPLYFTGVR